jgi:hypothetical protein
MTLKQLDWYAEIEEVKEEGSGEQSEAEKLATAAQGLSEGVDTKRVVECMGKEFRVAAAVGLMPLLRFAYFAKQGVDSRDIEGMAAVYEMLKDCIHEEDWAAFEQHTIDNKGFIDDLLPVVQQAIQVISANPTGEQSNSQESSSENSPGSMEDRYKELVPVGQLAS